MAALRRRKFLVCLVLNKPPRLTVRRSKRHGLRLSFYRAMRRPKNFSVTLITVSIIETNGSVIILR